MYLPHWSSHSLVSGKRALIQDRSLCMGSRRLAVVADQDPRVGQEPVRRNVEVGRRRHALENAAGEIELRLMAGTEKATSPIGSQIRRRDLGAKCWNAPEMGADADRHEDLGFDRAVFVL